MFLESQNLKFKFWIDYEKIVDIVSRVFQEPAKKLAISMTHKFFRFSFCLVGNQCDIPMSRDQSDRLHTNCTIRPPH
jgi:hypothetical protein